MLHARFRTDHCKKRGGIRARHANSIETSDLTSSPSHRYHAGVLTSRYCVDLVSWRRQLVPWLRDVSIAVGVSVGVFTSAVAIADSYFFTRVLRSSSYTSHWVQLVFLASLQLAAQAVGASPATLASIQRSIPLMSNDAFEECARRILAALPVQTMSDSKAPSNASKVLLDVSNMIAPVQGASLHNQLCDALHITTGTTPLSIASRLMRLLPLECASHILHAAIEALYTATLVSQGYGTASPRLVAGNVFVSLMQELEIHAFSPTTIATAAVLLAFHALGLSDQPVVTYWLIISRRAMHLDLATVRRCMLKIQHLAASAHVRNASHESIAHADMSVLLSGPESSQHFSLRVDHRRSFREATYVELALLLDISSAETASFYSSRSSAKLGSPILRAIEPRVELASPEPVDNLHQAWPAKLPGVQNAFARVSSEVSIGAILSLQHTSRLNALGSGEEVPPSVVVWTLPPDLLRSSDRGTPVSNVIAQKTSFVETMASTTSETGTNIQSLPSLPTVASQVSRSTWSSLSCACMPCRGCATARGDRCCGCCAARHERCTC